MARELGGKLARRATNAPQKNAAVLQRRAEPTVRTEEQRPVALTRGAGGRGGAVSAAVPASTLLKSDKDEIPEKGTPESQEYWNNYDPKKDDALKPKDDKKPQSIGEKVSEDFVVPRITKEKDEAPVFSWSQPEADIKPKAPSERETVQAGFQNNRTVTVREMSPEEWAGLNSEQQQAVITNYALYQASQADKAAAASADDADQSYRDTVSSIFGDKGGSDTYAPNTIRLLTELGYEDKTGDLDNFLDGQAVAGLNTILNADGKTDRTGAAGVADRLAGSAVFDTPEMTASLQGGAALLDALRVNNAVTPEFMSYAGTGASLNGLSELQMSDLSTTLNNMSNRGVWDLIQNDEEANTSLRTDLDKLVGELGQDVVTTYFANQLSGFSGDDTYMSFDEFTKNWLGK